MATYNIGEIIFVVSQKTQQVIPVQVVERIVKSTINGDEIIYKVIGPSGEGPHDLNQIDGEMYVDPKIIREELRQKAIKAIDRMVDNAIKVANNNFKSPTNQTKEVSLSLKNAVKSPMISLEPEDDYDDFEKENGAEIELPPGPDGVPRKAKVRSVIEASPVQKVN